MNLRLFSRGEKWQKLTAVAGIVLAVVLVVLLGYSMSWTGFGDFTTPEGEYVRGKTLWDWMQLFIIPIVLSLGAFYLNRSERNLEREIAIDRQREAALQAYLDRMAELLLEKELRESDDVEVKNIAKTRTLTVLRNLDARRKGVVLLFLHEAGLILGKEPIIELKGADLSNLELPITDLPNINLNESNLIGTNMYKSNLSGANLRGAKIYNANLLEANLSGADLCDADASGSDFVDANFSNANLLNTDFSTAFLAGANFENSNLSEAVFTEAKIDEQQLKMAKSLRGAVMPDGTIHE